MESRILNIEIAGFVTKPTHSGACTSMHIYTKLAYFFFNNFFKIGNMLNDKNGLVSYIYAMQCTRMQGNTVNGDIL